MSIVYGQPLVFYRSARNHAESNRFVDCNNIFKSMTQWFEVVLVIALMRHETRDSRCLCLFFPHKLVQQARMSGATAAHGFHRIS